MATTGDPTGRLVPAGAVEEFVSYRGGRVRLLRGGPPEGTPAALVHGGGPDNAAISWFEVFGALARSRPVLALDLPGFGYTTGVRVDGPGTGSSSRSSRSSRRSPTTSVGRTSRRSVVS